MDTKPKKHCLQKISNHILCILLGMLIMFIAFDQAELKKGQMAYIILEGANCFKIQHSILLAVHLIITIL